MKLCGTNIFYKLYFHNPMQNKITKKRQIPAWPRLYLLYDHLSQYTITSNFFFSNTGFCRPLKLTYFFRGLFHFHRRHFCLTKSVKRCDNAPHVQTAQASGSQLRQQCMQCPLSVQTLTTWVILLQTPTCSLFFIWITNMSYCFLQIIIVYIHIVGVEMDRHLCSCLSHNNLWNSGGGTLHQRKVWGSEMRLLYVTTRKYKWRTWPESSWSYILPLWDLHNWSDTSLENPVKTEIQLRWGLSGWC